MENKENSIKTPIVFILSLSFLGFILYLFFNIETNTNPLYTESNSKDKRELVVYPKQYSDIYTTVNAKVTDERFKYLGFSSDQNMLSNSISSLIKKDDSVKEENFLESGTWLWTPTLLITPEYRDSIISGAKENSINVIYMSLDSYLDIFVMPNSKEKEELKNKFDSIVLDFIKTANENGIEVDAEAGWQNWAEPGNLYKASVVLDYVINFNRRNEYGFRGFQYDVEVYLLTEYYNDRQKVLVNFLNLVNQTVTSLNNTDLQFSVVIPEFYDGSFEETPSFIYKGKKGYAVDHLLGILDRRDRSKIIIMSYRNFSLGKEGTVEISEDEIKKANKYNTKVVIAQETGDVPPPYITFYNKPRSYFDEQVKIVENKFSSQESFGGIAVHYINSFLELK